MPRTVNKRTKPDQRGRVKEEELGLPPVPVPEPWLVEPVEEWLKQRHNSFRSLPVAAPMMAIVCILHAEKRYLPVRSRLAEAIEAYRSGVDPGRARTLRASSREAKATGEKPAHKPTSDDAVDAVISSAAGNGDIEEVYRTEPGEVEHRASIRRRRYLIPCDELWQVYRSAQRAHARSHRLEDDRISA